MQKSIIKTGVFKRKLQENHFLYLFLKYYFRMISKKSICAMLKWESITFQDHNVKKFLKSIFVLLHFVPPECLRILNAIPVFYKNLFKISTPNKLTVAWFFSF